MNKKYLSLVILYYITFINPIHDTYNMFPKKNSHKSLIYKGLNEIIICI